MDIKLYDVEKEFESVKARIQTLDTPETNKELLFEFADDCLTGWEVKKISKTRTATLLKRLGRMTVMLKKEWIQFDEKDAKRMLQWIDTEYPWSDNAWSQHGYLIALRKFVTWMRKKKAYPEGYPNRDRYINALDAGKYALEVSKYHVKEPNKLRDANTIPNEQEMTWLSEACISPRDKAYIETSREHGERIGGLGTRQIKHISLDSLGAMVTMHDKTFRESQYDILDF